MAKMYQQNPMASLSQVHMAFVSTPMGDKPVTDLAGIGGILGQRLYEAGFDKAYKVLAQYLLLDMDKERFCNFLWETTHANSQVQDVCWNCIHGWCENFLL